MSARGLSIVDLIGLPPGTTALLPDDVRASLSKLAVVDFSVVASASAFIYTGTIQSLGETLFSSTLQWPIELPLLNVGVPFQLTRTRLPVAPGADLEPAPPGFQLDLQLQRVAIVVPGLQPAKLVQSAGTTPAHLVRPTGGDALYGRSVKIVGSATLRIASPAGGGAPLIRFVSPPDPFDASAPASALVSLGFEPAHFFFGSSDFGLTVDRLLYDDSESFTPAEIEARSHGPEWRGISIREATLYLPRNAPAVGDLSVGVRDVLLGSPLGMQGEVRVEFGSTTAAPNDLAFEQYLGSPPLPQTLGAPVAVAGAERSYRVTLASGSNQSASVAARSVSAARYRWTSHEDIRIDGSSYGPIALEPGDAISVARLEGSGSGEAESPAVSIQFVAATMTPRPSVNVRIGTLFQGVVHVAGPQAALAGMVFELEPATDAAYHWQLGSGPSAQTAIGASFTPQLPRAAGHHELTVRKPGETPQRVAIDVLDAGRVLVACRAGVFDGSAAVPVRAVEGSYDLMAFNARGEKLPSSEPAVVAAGALTVPVGTLASVTIEQNGSGGTSAPVTPSPVSRHVQVLMAFDATTPRSFIADGARPGAEPVPWDAAKLASWKARFAGAQFVVVGRTCDIGTAARNEQLGADRAAAGKALLGAGAAVFQRGERVRWSEPGADPGGEAVENGAAEIPADMKASAATDPNLGPLYDGWLIKIRSQGGWPSDATHEAHDRARYRRVDIHAVGGSVIVDPNDPPSSASQAGLDTRRMLVPGAVPGTLAPVRPRGATTPHRVRLVVRWDSPTLSRPSDAIPTQAEVTVAWQTKPLPVPGGANSVTPQPTQPSGNGPQVFTFIGGWTYDPRTTATQFSLALNASGNHDGLAKLSGDNAGMNPVAAALALGPALLAGLGSGDVASGVARVAALVAAIGFATAYGRDGQVAFHGIKVEWRQRAIDSLAGARLRLLCDYTASIGFQFAQGGISITADKPIKVRYRDVGIEIDSARSGFDAFGVVYENASFDIEDPGQWRINGPLGELIRVAAQRAGSGSTWIELDLKFALDLGVVKVTGCTLRASFANGGLAVEFRGFSASISLPGVVSGSGGVTIGDGGLIRAGLAANLIPINVSAIANLAMQGDFVALEVGVLLPVGIPLAQSGLALYGFIGRVVSNGKRNFDGIAQPDDPVQRELDWYARPGQDKYRPTPGQWAMGLGIAIGTMPDTGFTFNALGMLAVGFPDPDVVISIDAQLFQRPSLPGADNTAPPSGLKILGIIAISPRAVVIGVRGTYEVPKVLRLEMPFGAYFPLPGNPNAAFLRIGADGVNGRNGDPVQLRLLPDTLDIRVWAYTMVEERELLRLGGVEGFDLRGFSVGFGAGWTQQWGGGPVYLRASAKLLAGLGTKPLTVVAGVFVEGELRLICVSLSVRGNLQAKFTEAYQKISGEFCGKVDLFFFSVEGCVHCDFGSGVDPGLPSPDHPLTGIDLTDRSGAIVGRAYRSSDTPDPARPALAWPDTVPLLSFEHDVQNRLAGSAFNPVPAQLPGSPWSGSNDLKFAFRLTRLELRRKGAAALAGPLESVWWWPTHRGGLLDPSDPEPSDHEGRQLALLSWHPAPWSRHLSDGGKDTPADPGRTAGRICTPLQLPTRGCMRGDRLRRVAPERMRMSGIPGTRFSVDVTDTMPVATSMADAMASAAIAGWQFVAGGPQPLQPAVSVPAGPAAVTGAYRLASLSVGPRFVASLGATVTPSTALADAVLTLELCGQPRFEAALGPCDDYSDLKLREDIRGRLMRPSALYLWFSGVGRDVSTIVDHFAPGPDGKPELWFDEEGVAIVLRAPTNRVELTVARAEGAPVTAEALDGSGRVVARAVSALLQRQPMVLVLQAPGIVMLRLSGGGDPAVLGVNERSGGSLLKLCVGDTLQNQLAKVLLKRLDMGDAQRLPSVKAWLADGRTVVLSPRAAGAGSVGVGTAVGAEAGHHRCALVQYAAPAGSTVRHFEVGSWLDGRMSVVALCGTDWLRAHQHATNSAAQAGTAGSFAAHASPTSSERPNLLEANTEYEIVVGMQWARWHRDNNGGTAGPPAIDDSGLVWSDFAEQIYGFRTAPEVVLSAQPPAAHFSDERSFDPRGLVRHLLGFRPDGTGAPHFLDDPMQVNFRVDHIQPLLAKYGRTLALKLRRTDPPAASLAGFTRPPDMPITVDIARLDWALLETGDQRLVGAAEAQPCTDAPAVGGRSAQIEAALEPGADYDLLLAAPPLASPESDAVLIARTHFRASRYRGPGEMLQAMGLPTTGPADPRLPLDALVEPGLPATVAAPNDAAFEGVLRALGLDPWPLPALPRVVALWSKSTPFRLHGLMLETDEAMERPGRMQLSGIQVAGNALQRVVANTASTRAIWMAATPLALNGDIVIAVSVLDGSTPITGRRALLAVPRMALMEGLA